MDAAASASGWQQLKPNHSSSWANAGVQCVLRVRQCVWGVVGGMLVGGGKDALKNMLRMRVAAMCALFDHQIAEQQPYAYHYVLAWALAVKAFAVKALRGTAIFCEGDVPTTSVNTCMHASHIRVRLSSRCLYAGLPQLRAHAQHC